MLWSLISSCFGKRNTLITVHNTSLSRKMQFVLDKETLRSGTMDSKRNAAATPTTTSTLLWSQREEEKDESGEVIRGTLGRGKRQKPIYRGAATSSSGHCTVATTNETRGFRALSFGSPNSTSTAQVYVVGVVAPREVLTRSCQPRVLGVLQKW